MSDAGVAARDDAIAAMLPHVPSLGWSVAALRAGLVGRGGDAGAAEWLFDDVAAGMIAAFIDRADREMEADVAAIDMAGLRVPQRVHAVIAARLRRMGPHRAAVRRAAGVLMLPRNGRVALRCTARTVDAIWHAAGDRSADFNWYTKRALLAGIYTTTLLFWLRQEEEDDAATLAFLDRRLAGSGRIGAVRRRVEGMLARFRPAAA